MKKFAKALCVLFVALVTIISPFGSASAFAIPELLKDTNTKGRGSDFNENIGAYSVNGVALYEVCEPEYGCELWASDGTENGTVLLEDITPGSDGASIDDMVVVGNHAYFNARVGEDGEDEVWVTDGTPSGTYQLDLSGDGILGQIEDVYEFNSLAYILVEYDNDYTLYKTNGSEGNTTVVSVVEDYINGLSFDYIDVELLGATDASLYLHIIDEDNVSAVGSGLFALRNSDASLVEIVGEESASFGSYEIYDGIGAGPTLYFNARETWDAPWTYMVGDLETEATLLVGSADEVIRDSGYFTVVNDIVVFRGCTYNSQEDCEPWRSDGTKIGTYRFADINTGNGSSNFEPLSNNSSILYFSANNEDHESDVYVTDGTSFTKHTSPNHALSFSYGAVYAGDLYFRVCDETGDYTRCELWKVDATTGFETVYEGESEYGVGPEEIVALSGGVVFAGNDPLLGFELWFSNGTEVGTELIYDFNTYTEGSSGEDYVHGAEINGKFIFASTNPTTGREPWVSDGTADGTEILEDLSEAAGSSYPYSFTAYNGYVYFLAETGTDENELWRTDGSTTQRVLGEADGYTYLSDIVNYDDYLWIKAGYEGNDVVLRYDGTNASRAGAGIINNVGDFVTAGGSVYFQAGSVEAGTTQLWVSDGITVSVVDNIEGDLDNVWKNYITASEDRVFFMADVGGGLGGNLWVTDGTTEGTYMVKDIDPRNSYSSISEIRPAAGGVYFEGIDEYGNELWYSDGTEEGTYMLFDLVEGSDSYPDNMTEIGDLVYFSAYVDDVRNLWASDGTLEGTFKLNDFDSEDTSGDPMYLTDIGSILFFTFDDGEHGREIWTSDGTVDGTEMLYDINEGYSGSDVYNFYTFGDNLIVFAYTEQYGQEPWIIGDVDTGPTDPEPEPEPEEEQPEESSRSNRSSGRRSRQAEAARGETGTVSLGNGATLNLGTNNGSTGSASSGGNFSIRELQKFLNARGFTVAATGPGSTGNETDTFGSATQAALMKFQAANGLPAQGIYGPMTKAKIAELLGATSWMNDAPASPTLPSATTRDLQVGDQGDDVRTLQQALIARGYPIAAGATGYFGEQTRVALAAWQTANGITPAAGYYGPRTQAVFER